MKINYVIWLSAMALIILVLSQYFLITETFNTRRERINSSYIDVVRKGLYAYEDLLYQYAFDSLFSSFDEEALMYLVYKARNDSITFQFEQKLNASIDLDRFLTSFVRQNGLDPGLRSAFLIRSLTLIDLSGDRNIFLDTLFRMPADFRDPLMVSSFKVERNYYRMTYDYIISIDHKTGMIMGEMKLTLLFVLFSIALVFTVFFLSLRNMLIQKRLSDLKSDFINNMTHELKTPLSTISVASSSLINPDLTLNRSRIKELSSLIKKQNKHLSELIDRILDISIWEKDQVRILKKSVDIRQFISEVVRAFQVETNGKVPGIRIEWDIKDQYADIDEIHMTTLMNNLLLNAQKYGSDNPEITLHVKRNSHLIISVTDNGPGISRDEQNHVFEKFYRGSNSKTRAIKGLGLGLYYVKQIVSAHQGEIRLRSEPGEGTTFEIKIPMNDEYSAG